MKAITHDGQRFLINLPVEESKQPPAIWSKTGPIAVAGNGAESINLSKAGFVEPRVLSGIGIETFRLRS